jgi:hypothetical protein
VGGTGSRPVRIANCSGFYGDRLAALSEMVRGGPVDVVTGDYLAEVTMLVLAKVRSRRPGGGYAASFLRQLEPVAGEIADRGIKVVVNAGGLDPAGLAEATRELLARLGVPLAVAHVEGDDLTARLDALAADGGLANADTGAPFAGWGRRPLTANAYLGGFGIAAALAGGADVVVAGRVADASLASGAAAWWWGWGPGDHDALAGAVVAGHVIECGAQATGGNFSGFGEIPGLEHPGFPIAEVERDGSSVITKHPGSGGAVTVDTVTAQLLYEVDRPAYLNPDVVARLDSVRLERAGEDRVRIGPVAGSPPPPTTKVAVTALGDWHNTATLVLTGLDVDAKARLAEAAVRARLRGVEGIADLRFRRVGVAADDPDDQLAGSCLLQVAVEGDEAGAGRAFSAALVELALANYPGLYGLGPPGAGAASGAYWPALVPQDAVPHTVVHPDGHRAPIPPPPVTAPPPASGDAPGLAGPEPPPSGGAPGPGGPDPRRADFGPTVDGALGRLVHARSGDKGGNANLGVWVRDPEAWPWLAATLTTGRLRELLPETAGLEIDRYELPNLRAVNFVIHGLLGGGATEARRFDAQAKALGEWLRARHAPLPAALLNDR